MATNDPVGVALTMIRDHASRTLEDEGVPAGLISLLPGGTVSWDRCDCEGQLWVRLISATPQPTPSQACDITDLQVQGAIGLVRCFSGLDQEGTPTAAEMDGDTLQMTRDMMILLDVLQTVPLPTSAVPKTFRVERGTPLGPNGLCGGWEWTFSFRTLLCG